MDVVPHCGLDNIRLGDDAANIRALLGDPDKTSRDQHGDGEYSEIWIYRLLRLELSFDSEHAERLSHVSSYHPYTLVNGFNPMGLETRFLLQKFPHLDLDVAISDEEKYYTDKILGLTYGIARNKVVSVTVFPEVSSDGQTIIWPSAD